MFLPSLIYEALPILYMVFGTYFFIEVESWYGRISAGALFLLGAYIHIIRRLYRKAKQRNQ